MLKQVVIAASFGISATMDTYIVAASVVGLIMLWVRLPVRETLIPLFRHTLARQGERSAWSNASVLLNNFVVVLVLIVVAGEFLAPYIVGVLAPGFDAESGSMATSLARITMITVVFMGMGTLLAQISYSYEKFFRPGIVGTVNNIVVIAALFMVGTSYGIYGLAVAVVFGAAFEFVLQLPILWQKRKLYSSEINLRHPEMIQMGKLSFPLLISTGGQELARITDRIFASLLSAGSLSALAFAHRPVSVLLDFLINPLQQAIFPRFTKLSAEQDFPRLSRELFYYLRIVVFFTLPAAIGAMMTAEAMIKTLYQRGAFDETAVQLTSQALVCYAIGFPALAVMRVLRRTFFGLKNTVTPTKIAVSCIGIKIVLSAILIQYFSHLGIALAESIAQIINACLLFYLLPAELKGHEGWRTVTSFARTAAGCAIMGAAVYFTRGTLYAFFSPALELVFLVLLGCAVYGIVACFLQAQAMQAAAKIFLGLGAKSLSRSS